MGNTHWKHEPVIDLVSLTPSNLDQAMQLVTESFDLDVRRGWRDDDFREDWLIAYQKLSAVAEGYPFLGLVGYQNRNQPIALSVVTVSPAYGPTTGLWDWFFVSPRTRKTAFPMRMASETLGRAMKAGADNFVMFVGADNRPVERMMDLLGAKPVEVEYRVDKESLRSHFLRAPLRRVGSNGKQVRN